MPLHGSNGHSRGPVEVNSANLSEVERLIQKARKILQNGDRTRAESLANQARSIDPNSKHLKGVFRWNFVDLYNNYLIEFVNILLLTLGNCRFFTRASGRKASIVRRRAVLWWISGPGRTQLPRLLSQHKCQRQFQHFTWTRVTILLL